MLFRQMFDAESATYTYLVAADYGAEAVLIDPVKRNIDAYIKLIDQFNLTVKATIDTHLHADHITALGPLRQKLGCLTMMGKQSLAESVDVRFADNDVLKFAGFELTALYTPGHTDDSYCLLLGDRVFTGDTLFIRGTGRTDFQNGSARAQYNSIVTRLYVLADETLVYPGHDYNGMTVSTIGEEKQFNPRLMGKTLDAYVQLMNDLNLPDPKMMNLAIPANIKCGIDD